MTRLIVTAGGGGDAVAASMLHASLYGEEDQAVILTYAWDRLLIDPLPGPRRSCDFTGLERLTPTVWVVTAQACPIVPAGSTLPRLASELPHTFTLLDPCQGVEGLTHQLADLIHYLGPQSIDLLDVGGDILARGGEPTLRSPLADALALAACSRMSVPVRLLVAGPGLDGELLPEEVADVLGPAVHTFTARDVDAISSVLEWHPSEATGMLAAAARGVRGTCEIRDAGLPVALTDDSPTVYEVDLANAVSRNQLAQAIMATTHLDEAEAHSREVCGFSEIDYERNKALRLKKQQPTRLDPATIWIQLGRFEAEARSRGVTHTTFRRITEALDLSGSQRDYLRKFLVTNRPGQHDAPLWRIPAT